MTDLDPAIWENPTLGKAANNERLDRLERQQLEDRSAKLEDRTPREIVVDNDYPDYIPETNPRTGTVSSIFNPVHFDGENPNDVIQTGEGMKPEGMTDEEWNAQQSTEESEATTEATSETTSESEPTVETAPSENVSEGTNWSA